jgi:DNA polymerase III alpha subunit
MGVAILHPSVNRSEDRFTVEDLERGGRAVRIGLSRVKSLSVRSRAAILEARRSGGPFTSLGDFLRRAPMPRREVEPLILSGAFDDLPPPRGAPRPLNHPQLLWELESALDGRGPGEAPGPAPDLVRVEGRADHPPLPAYEPMVRIRNEIDALELAVTDHPMRLLRDEARGRGCRTTLDAAARTGRARVAGVVAATRKVRTQKGEMMQFVTIEDEVGLLESTLFPAAYRSHGAVLRALGPYIFEGRVEDDRGGINMNLSRIERWDP